MKYFAVAWVSLNENVQHIEFRGADNERQAMVSVLVRIGWDLTGFSDDVEEFKAMAFDCDMLISAREIPL